MRFKLLSILIATTLIASLTAGCSKKSGEIGGKDNPILFYFMPIEGVSREETFKKNAPVLKKYVESATGLAIEIIYTEDVVEIVKAFGQGKADIAFLNTLGYLLAGDWTKVEPRLKYVYGDLYTSYRGEIIARVDSGIDSPSGISGKIFAFVSPYSASGYLYAVKYLKDHNVQPAKTVFAGSHKRAVEMVYNKEADAAVAFYERPEDGSAKDGRAELIAEHPDVISAVKIIDLTGEMATGPITVRHNLPPEIKTRLTDAIFNFSRTIEGRRVLLDLYDITGFAEVQESDYTDVRAVIKELGKTIQDLVPGGAPYFKTDHIPGLE